MAILKFITGSFFLFLLIGCNAYFVDNRQKTSVHLRITTNYSDSLKFDYLRNYSKIGSIENLSTKDGIADFFLVGQRRFAARRMFFNDGNPNNESFYVLVWEKLNRTDTLLLIRNYKMEVNKFRFAGFVFLSKRYKYKIKND